MTYFIISSPFQAVCCYEYIKTESLKEYKIILHLSKTDNRYLQIVFFLGKRIPNKNIIFTGINIYESYKILRKLAHEDYVIIGDCYDLRLYFWGVYLLNRFGHISYIDDGASTITYINKSIKMGYIYIIKKSIIDIIRYVKNIKFLYFFTIFNVKSDLFLIKKNNLQYLFANCERNVMIDIIIIGTNIKSYCKFNNISEIKFLDIVKDIINTYTNNEILYIRHGKCENRDILHICDALNIKHYLPNSTIEVDCIEKGIKPSTIIGFDSTALYTMKSLFPRAKVINIQILSSVCHKSFHDNNMKLLQQEGISTQRIVIND